MFILNEKLKHILPLSEGRKLFQWDIIHYGYLKNILFIHPHL